MAPTSLDTDRLLLRPWRDDDRASFAELNADPVVMEHFPSTLTREASDVFVERIETGFDELGFGLWALELRETGEFVGFTGLMRANFDAHFTPAIEVGWRLARRFWGAGLAPEAARAAIDDGFERVGLDEIVSFTAVANHNSRRVMEKVGMTHDPSEDFDHPSVEPGHVLQRHVLYRLSADTHRRHRRSTP